MPRKTRNAGAAVAEPETGPASQPEGMQFFGPCEVVELVRRTRAADPGAGGEAREEEVYDITISSENPVVTPWGHEVLGHGPGEVDLRNAKVGISWLLEHGGPQAPWRVDPEYHAGFVTNLRVEDRKLKGEVAWAPEASTRVRQAEAAFRAGKRPYVSVGWVPGPKYHTKIVKRDGMPDEIRRIGWMPGEASSVSVPADFVSRKGRSGPGIEGFPVITEGGKPPKEERSMKKVRDTNGSVIEVEDSDPRPAVTDAPSAGGQRSAAEITAEATRRSSQIVRLCQHFGVQERTNEFIEGSLSVPEVCDKILETRGAKPHGHPATDSPPMVPGVPQKDARRYSVLRAIRCAVSGKYDGLEGALHAECAKLHPASAAGAGGERRILIPLRVAEFTEDDSYVRQTRAMGTGIADAGAALVTTTQMELIDILRNAAMCARLGARTITGLVGNVEFPKKTADPIVRRMGENPAAGAAESSGKYGWVLGSPKTYIGVDVVPRQLIASSSFDVEASERQSLVAQHGLSLDYDGIHGSGAANVPLGIYPNTLTQSLAMGGVPSYKKLIKMLAMAGEKNIPGSAMGYLTTLLQAAEQATTLKASNVPGFVWEGPLEDGRIAGQRAAATNQVSKKMSGREITGAGTEHGLICGAWENMIFLIWGVLEVMVDSVTLADKHQIKIVSSLLADVVNVRPEGFVVATGATVSA